MDEFFRHDGMIWAVGGAAAAVVLVLLAEWLHLRRIRRVSDLAFGPGRGPAKWVRSTPFLRAIAAGLVVWGLVVLWLVVEPKVHASGTSDEEARHLVLVLDVSPSMRVEDAGPTGEQSRMHRARDVLQSMFSRVAIGKYRISVVATYNGAAPVVIDTSDAEVVRNILGDLPMQYAFKPGKTRLFDGLEEAAKICEPWEPRTATVVVVSDGDTVPPTGIPKMPPSVSGVLVVGVGDPVTGTFLNGAMSRQDAGMLRQVAVRLGGSYHDGNKRHVATEALRSATAGIEPSPLEGLGLRESALLAVALGALALALIPWLLNRFGTAWRPGAVRSTASPGAGASAAGASGAGAHGVPRGTGNRSRQGKGVGRLRVEGDGADSVGVRRA